MAKRTITADIREACERLGYDRATTKRHVQKAKGLPAQQRRALAADLRGMAKKREG